MLMDLKQAYHILGLRENASRDEIERKFTIILKKHRMSQSSGGEPAEGQSAADTAEAVDMDEVTRAYNILMGYEEEQTPEKWMAKPNPLLKKMGVDEKKARNFFHYHKIHIVVAIIAIIVLVTTLRSCINRVEPDINLAFVGAFYYADTEPFEKAIKDKLADIKEIGIDGAMLTENMDGQQAYAMQMKAMVLFAAGDIDVFILDKENYEKYAKQGAFSELDALIGPLGIDAEKAKASMIQLEESQISHIYGIDVTGNPLFDSYEIVGEQKIAALGVNAEHRDMAVKLMELPARP